MCVTIGPAVLGQTMAYTYATLLNEDRRTEHISGYQTTATDLSGKPNMMLLHFPGDSIQMVHGPQDTQFFMSDLTGWLPSLEHREINRGTFRSFSPQVQKYGTYTVVVAEYASDILDVLERVPVDVRPLVTTELLQMIEFYDEHFPSYCFVLICWRGEFAARHPIVVKYVPHNDDVLYVPGIEAHDGGLPSLGALGSRDFKVAFAADGYRQPYSMQGKYQDRIDPSTVAWAPFDVTGFHDNRRLGENLDYLVPLQSVMDGYKGQELFAEAIC